MQGNLCPDKKALSGHLFGLLNAHGGKDSWGDITQDTVLLLEAPALGGIGQDEGHLVGSVRGLGLALLVEHLFGVTTSGG